MLQSRNVISSQNNDSSIKRKRFSKPYEKLVDDSNSLYQSSEDEKEVDSKLKCAKHARDIYHARRVAYILTQNSEEFNKLSVDEKEKIQALADAHQNMLTRKQKECRERRAYFLTQNSKKFNALDFDKQKAICVLANIYQNRPARKHEEFQKRFQKRKFQKALKENKKQKLDSVVANQEEPLVDFDDVIDYTWI